MLSTLNGRALSWSDIKITANIVGGPSMPQIDIKSINFEGAISRGFQVGASGGRRLKKTSGSLTNTCDATFYTDGMDEFIDAIAAVAPKNSGGQAQLSKVSFDFVIKHTFEDESQIRTVTIKGCNLDKLAEKHGEGDDAATIDTDLSPMEIEYTTRSGLKAVLL